jgi:hypothetical protein
MPAETAMTADIEPCIFSYALRVHAGHLIAEVAGRRLLLDTGAPLSIGPEPLEIAGRRVEPNRGFLGVTIDALQADVGTPIDALIGMDVLREYDLRIDAPAGRLEMTPDDLELDDRALPLSELGWIPMVKAMFSPRRQASLLFDTGASLSYLRRELLRGCRAHGEAEDFYPGFGRFTTPVYRLLFVLGSRTYYADFGVLPQLLELALIAEGSDGILGSELLLERPAVLAARRGLLSFGGNGIDVGTCIRDGDVH